MKEDVSLDELADVFTPTMSGLSFSREEILRKSVAPAEILDFFMELSGAGDSLGYNETLMLYCVSRLIAAGDIGREEAKTLLEVLKETAASVGLEGAQAVLIRKLGVFFCFIVKPPGLICVEKNAKIIGRIDMDAMIEELKLKLL
jgi:hypothetical protein